MLVLFALHLSDGLLPFDWCLAGWLGAVALVLLGSWRLREEEIPRVALLTAAFFVSSAIHVPLGVTSAHLLLNGLVGVLLGWRAGVAIFLGLLLQMAFLGHGGWTTIGINTLVMAVPALIGGYAFRTLVRLPRLRTPAAVSLLGGALGLLCVLASLVLQSAVLLEASDAGIVPAALWLTHLPLVVIEAAILATTMGFLCRVKPELIGCAGMQDVVETPPAREPQDLAKETLSSV